MRGNSIILSICPWNFAINSVRTQFMWSQNTKDHCQTTICFHFADFHTPCLLDMDMVLNNYLNLDVKHTFQSGMT